MSTYHAPVHARLRHMHRTHAHAVGSVSEPVGTDDGSAPELEEQTEKPAIDEVPVVEAAPVAEAPPMESLIEEHHETDDQGVDFGDLSVWSPKDTKARLLAVAAAKGLAHGPDVTKADIVALLQAAQ